MKRAIFVVMTCGRGMGPRIREDTGGCSRNYQWGSVGVGRAVPEPPLRFVDGASLSSNDGWGMGPRNREDTEGRAPPFLRRAEGSPNLAASVGVRDLGGCWVPAFAGTRIGRGSWAWMGARFFVAGPPQNDIWVKREDHPHPSLPPQGGREGGVPHARGHEGGGGYS